MTRFDEVLAAEARDHGSGVRVSTVVCPNGSLAATADWVLAKAQAREVLRMRGAIR